MTIHMDMVIKPKKYLNRKDLSTFLISNTLCLTKNSHYNTYYEENKA